VHLNRIRTRLALLGAAAAAAAVVLGGLAPAVATADTGGANTIKVLPATKTISPPATGGSFSVDVVANAGTAMSGAGAALSFDKTRLTLTGVTIGPAVASLNGSCFCGTIAGYPVNVAAAQAAGQIPTVGFSFGNSGAPSGFAANTDVVIYTAAFTVSATGDSTLAPSVGTTGGILDGNVATYGQALPVTLVDGHVVNSAPATAAITPLAAWLATNTVPVKWSGTGMGTLTYDVQYRKAPYSTAAFGALTPWQTGVTATTANFTTSPGYTYCFSVRTHDDNGVSAYTPETCTAAPLDDRSLTKSGTWSAKTGSAYYRSTAMYSSSNGAKLTRTGVHAKRIVLVATTCSTCGSVKVAFAGSTKTISLKSTTTVNKKLIAVFTLTSVKSSTLTITVYGSGKKVYIDGVVLSAK